MRRFGTENMATVLSKYGYAWELCLLSKQVLRVV